MRPWQIPIEELSRRYDELNTVLDVSCFSHPLHVSYISIMVDNCTSSRDYAKTRDEMFEYFDYLPEDERYECIIDHEARSISNTKVDSCLRYLPVYFIPRLRDGRISVISFKGFIVRLFSVRYTPALDEDNHTIILHKGWASLFVRLVLDGTATHDDMMAFFDEMDGLFDPNPGVGECGQWKNLIVSRYRPPSLPNYIYSRTSYGDIIVTVSWRYWNTVLFTGVMREILAFVQSPYDDHQELISLFGRLRLILEIDVAAVLLPCLTLVSEVAATDLIAWLMATADHEELFPNLYCSGNTEDEHSLIEKTLIAIDTRPLLSYYLATRSDACISRHEHLIKMHTDNV